MELVFALQVPNEIIHISNVSAEEKVSALLQWVEDDAEIGWSVFLEVLGEATKISSDRQLEIFRDAFDEIPDRASETKKKLLLESIELMVAEANKDKEDRGNLSDYPKESVNFVAGPREEFSQGQLRGFDQLKHDILALPDDAQHLVAELVAFLRQRYPIAEQEVNQLIDLDHEPFVGIWRDRSEMQDSTTWVRQVRKQHWRGYHG